MENKKLQAADLVKNAENKKGAKPFKFTAKQKSLIKAFEKANGNISKACKLVGSKRDTFYRHYNTVPEFKEVIELIRDKDIDLYEDELKLQSFGQYTILKNENGDAVIDQNGEPVRVYHNQPNITGVIFALKTLGKSRGYVQRTEVTGADGNAIGVTEIHVVKPKRPEKKK